MQQLPIVAEQYRVGRVADFGGTVADQIEHRLRVAGRGRHRLQHVDGGGLVLDLLAVGEVALGQRRRALLQLAVSLGAANRNHRLLGKGSQ